MLFSELNKRVVFELHQVIKNNQAQLTIAFLSALFSQPAPSCTM